MVRIGLFRRQHSSGPLLITFRLVHRDQAISGWPSRLSARHRVAGQALPGGAQGRGTNRCSLAAMQVRVAATGSVRRLVISPWHEHIFDNLSKSRGFLETGRYGNSEWPDVADVRCNLRRSEASPCARPPASARPAGSVSTASPQGHDEMTAELLVIWRKRRVPASHSTSASSSHGEIARDEVPSRAGPIGGVARAG